MRDQLFFPNGITNMHGGEGGEGLLLVMNLTQAATPMRQRLQPYVTEAGKPTCSRLQPYVIAAATLCDRGWLAHVLEAATLCDSGCNPM